ncbi:TonB family protein [Campylobacter geochelonis]|uniref:TonB family protein n=1 Tax=Campylobacter geochelonis TaxID=1780362 RepID=UPI00077073A5|nr:energy transducer TonB [Campylobacter geochelonis]CZE46809.1 Ferric siderophore transport system%2C periplasmic binding protein TonB [Campylobacter geochelonis]
MRRVWVVGFGFSCLLHLCILLAIFYRPTSLESGGVGAQEGEFKGIMLVSNLPIGELKEVSIEQIKSEKNEEEFDETSDEELFSDIDEDLASLYETSSQINLKKNQKTAQNDKIKKEKKLKKEKKPLSSFNSDTNSKSKDNAQSAPLPGDSATVQNGTYGTGANQKASYQSALMAHLNRYKSYPNEALIRGEEGVVMVKVTIDKFGNVLSKSIKKGSKFSALDSATLELFLKASPLPKPPNEFLNASGMLTFSLPISYNIQEYYKNR